ncbi:histone deacetylase [Nocardia sp. JW2]|uniref:histone deacetylase n=1 Tax=Nocardia sp. JW2 TaxID=3450738 RepID=UPI003F43EB6E
MTQQIWYAAYGSNMCAARFDYYRLGGTPPGTDHLYAGFRDPTPPAKTTALTVPGTVYFAWQSPVWTGGVAFYTDQPAPGWPNGAVARGYLLTLDQFADLLDQEMYRTPGRGFDVSRVVEEGRVRFGPGRYETVVHLGDEDGVPILTFTAPWLPEAVEVQPPSARYLAMIGAGLREGQGWDTDRIVDYLRVRPGVAGQWDERELRAALLSTHDTG